MADHALVVGGAVYGGVAGGATVEIDIFGDRRPGTVAQAVLVDPMGARMPA